MDIYKNKLIVSSNSTIAITYVGLGICSYNLTKEGAIFIATVSTVKIRFACLGLDLGTSP